MQGAGNAYVVFGKTDGATVTTSALNGYGFKISGATSGEAAGYDVSLAGDVNDDGLADIAVGAPLSAPNGTKDAGRAYVVFGRASGDVSLGNLGDAGQTFDGPATGTFAGGSVASIGDVNFDGLSDLAVGMIDGAVVVPAAVTPRAIVLTEAAGAQRLTGPAQPQPALGLGGVPGAVVESAQDLDDDTQADMLIGFPGDDSIAGTAYAVYGDETRNDLDLPSAPGQRATRVEGPVGSRFGTALASPRAPSWTNRRLYAGAPGDRANAGSVSGTSASSSIGASARASSAQAAFLSTHNDPNNPYVVRFLSAKGTNNTPFARTTLAGNVERPDTPVGEERFRMGFSALQRNTALSGSPRRWNFVDSFGSKIATIEQNPRTKKVEVFRQDGTSLGFSRKPKKNQIKPVRFGVQGKGCIAVGDGRQYLLVSVASGSVNPFADNVGTRDINIGIRAFLPVDAVAPAVRGAGVTMRCGRTLSNALPRPTPLPVALSPGYARKDVNAQYQGRRTARACPPSGIAINSRNCGTPQAQYTAPEFADNLLYVTDSSTFALSGV